MSDYIMLKIENVSKKYKLGQIGGTTLRDELQRKRAKRKGLEDPTTRIGQKKENIGEEFYALSNVSFEIKKGERVGVIGHNGAGKSTLLKLISRVTAPTDGTIYMNGRVASMLEVGTGFHPELTGRENIYMNGAILGMSKKEIDSKIEDIIEFSECRQFIDTPVKRYSSGMYVKLAFSVAAHLDSEILIMDEVLAVGDMAFQKKCLDKMNDVSRQDGRTILYVSHNMNTIRQLCDRVIVLDHGRVMFSGDVENGIKYYLGNINNLNIEYNFVNKRNDIDIDRKVRFISVKFLNKEFPIYEHKEQIYLRLILDNRIRDNNWFIRIILKNEFGNPVAMTTSNKKFNIGFGRQTLDILLPHDFLSHGRYTAKLVSYTNNEYGSGVNHDIVDNAFSFEIIDRDNIFVNWKSNLWGNFYLPSIEEL